jgi:hypothetical protein
MYRFERMRVSDGPAAIAARLNQLAAEGWYVVSHADDQGNYSFVLRREPQDEQ